MLFSPTVFASSSHRRSYFTAASLKAFQVALVKPVASLKYSVTSIQAESEPELPEVFDYEQLREDYGW